MEKLIDADALADAIQRERDLLIERGQYGAEHILAHHFERIMDDVPTVDAIPVEWLKKVRKDDRLTIDDVETIDLILTWWQKEQEARSI